MKRRIFGLENEYGVTCTHEGRSQLPPDTVARYLFDKVTPSIRNANVFLENGARLYLDSGFHPEYATPECDDLMDLVAYDRAGERIIGDLVREAEQRLAEDGIEGSILLFKNNTDSAGNTYGCHENYLVSRDVPFSRLIDVLTPFLVSRQVFAGAGKVVPTVRGLQYCLAQRASYISDEISGTTVSSRPIINTRDEPHADAERYRRLHLILGDSNMSEVATYLKMATTALVLDLIEDGFFARDVTLEAPVHALRAISRDTTLRDRVRLRDGRTFTAVEVQRTYLEACEAYVQHVGSDPVTRDVLDRWGDILERLADDPLSARREVDWVIKKNLIDAFMGKRGLSLDDPRISLIDLQYHDIRPNRGLYHLLARNGNVERLVPEAAVEDAKHRPPQTTRARVRGNFIRRANLQGKDYQVDWIYVKLVGRDSETVFCKDPFIAHDARVEALVA